MVVADDDPAAIRRTLEALRGQTTTRWSLTVVSREGRLDELRALVLAATSVPGRRRVTIHGVAGETSVGDLLWEGIRATLGSPRALIFPGDLWAPDAIALLGAALTSRGVVYADEDEVRPDGTYAGPRLKPDFSAEFLLTTAYVGRPLAMGASVADGLPRPVASGIAPLEHECALAACEVADVVTHISEVLCHRMVEPDVVSGPNSVRHIREALRRRRDAGGVVAGPAPGDYRILRPAATGVPVSILIPFRDEPRFLRTCVDSIMATTAGHASVELVLIDNGSSDPETLTLVERLGAHPDVCVLTDPSPFNWAALNNAGARAARGEVLLFLNNDIEAHQGGWLSALCAQALRPDVATVGARLLYPDRRLQHCGLVVGLTGAAGHVLGGLAGDEPGYLHMATAARECSAVTGACLATRHEVFELLNGFDETLGVDLNDVDYCLRAATLGLRTIYEPGAELIHHESPSRGTAGGVEDIVRFVDRWKEYIARGDRYLNPHLSRADGSCRLAGPEEEDSWDRWYSTLSTP